MKLYTKLLLFTIGAAFLTLLGIRIGTDNFVTGLGIGVAITVSILVFIVSLMFDKKKHIYTVIYFVNGLTSGFLIAEYFIKYNHTVSNSTLISALGLFALLSFLVLTLTSIIESPPLRGTVILLIVVIGYIYTINGWINNDTVLYSILFFILHIIYAGAILLHVTETENDKFYKRLYIASYVYFILVLVIISLILSEGDILEGVGTIDFGGSKKPKNNNSQ